jgi:Fe-S-cluster containining protein
MFDRSAYPQAMLAEVAALLAEVDAEIAARQPVCRASGKCCKFEEYGHRLYVTGAELALFARQLDAPPDSATHRSMPIQTAPPRPMVSLPQFFSSDAPRGCPYQIDGLCTAREARPLGCRIYFCDERTTLWQNDLYERFHTRLTELHQQHAAPYAYVEWRAGLRSLIDAAPI